VAVAAFIALMQPLLPTISLADATKDYPLCIQACNDARAVCDDRCTADCLALFPLPSQNAQRTACTQTCKALCVAAEQDCKDRCKAIKNGDCPSEP